MTLSTGHEGNIGIQMQWQVHLYKVEQSSYSRLKIEAMMVPHISFQIPINRSEDFLNKSTETQTGEVSTYADLLPPFFFQPSRMITGLNLTASGTKLPA